jgi:DNA helicase-2/ATP-dependent DNA helicase PcrA
MPSRSEELKAMGKKLVAKDSPLSQLLKRSLEKLQAQDDGPEHVVVKALAGTGKTTTLVEGLKEFKGISSELTPSSLQKAVWEAICLSRGHADSACFAAFGNDIAAELARRVPPGCEAVTTHKMGFRAVREAIGYRKPNKDAVEDLICELLEEDLKVLRRTKPVVLAATASLVDKCKLNLVDWKAPHFDEELAALATRHDIDLNGDEGEVFDLVPQILEMCLHPEPGREISFADMLWLPIVLNLPVYRYDLLLVDESQDLNRAQHELAKRAGRRLIFVGDENQAIYGFAGADSESLPRLQTELEATERGCISLPLNVTYRCGKAIVREAQRYVPDFQAHEHNPEGLITMASLERGSQDYRTQVASSDMVLCRVNAPLVSECFKFIASGRKANILGRKDMGEGLIKAVERLWSAGAGAETFVANVDEWLHKEQKKENARRRPDENRLANLQDRHDCLMIFSQEANTVGQAIAKINSIFTDDRDNPGIRLSSIHKAKGLESKRVFLLQPKGVGPRADRMQDWQLGQERNLMYVAITRAIDQFAYVKGGG